MTSMDLREKSISVRISSQMKKKILDHPKRLLSLLPWEIETSSLRLSLKSLMTSHLPTIITKDGCGCNSHGGVVLSRTTILSSSHPNMRHLLSTWLSRKSRSSLRQLWILWLLLRRRPNLSLGRVTNQPHSQDPKCQPPPRLQNPPLTESRPRALRSTKVPLVLENFQNLNSLSSLSEALLRSILSLWWGRVPIDLNLDRCCQQSPIEDLNKAKVGPSISPTPSWTSMSWVILRRKWPWSLSRKPRRPDLDSQLLIRIVLWFS